MWKRRVVKKHESSVFMLWAKTCVYICSGRAGGNERDLLFYVRYEEPCPHPTPPHPTRSCVASTMCSSSKNVIIPTPPHPQLRSIHHVFKFKECHHAQPTPPHPQLRSIHHVFKLKNVIIPTPPHPTPAVA